MKTDFLQRAVVIRTTGMTNYAFNPIDERLFKGKAKIAYDANAKMRDDEFWAAHRTMQLTKSEAGMDSFIKRMAKTRHFKWVMFASKALIENLQKSIIRMLILIIKKQKKILKK